MDNGAVTAESSQEPSSYFQQLSALFAPYEFYLQKFVTNDTDAQTKIDEKSHSSTPLKSKLLGLCWDRINDTLSCGELSLNGSATTKRQILSSIASNYDLFNYNGPILNRARLFMHELQHQSDLGWDDKLSNNRVRTWKNISKQLNKSSKICIPQFVGKRADRYNLIAFVDISKLIYDTVVFIQCLSSGSVSFLLAKNRLVNKQLESKSIPSLELQAIHLGVETLLDVYNELSGTGSVVSIAIINTKIYSDSLICLSRLHSYSCKSSKMNKCSIFVINRLQNISKMCETFPIEFNFRVDIENPAASITRSLP